jgi:hypothetical protein
MMRYEGVDAEVLKRYVPGLDAFEPRILTRLKIECNVFLNV